jgi:outer membrane receptor for ferrienterochelin and colicins
MKMVITLLFSLFTLASFADGDPVNATTTLSGQVIEAGSAEKLTGVRVTVKGTDVFTYTDRDGNFELSNVPAGQVELLFSLVSFEIKAIGVATVPGETAEVAVELLSR